jgi:NSS family neurotransmitter:Na+ symporter
MATTTGTDINNVVTQGTGLAFIVFPSVLNIMGPIAYIIGPIFFLCIFFAGITTSISYVEPMINAVGEKFDIGRKRATTYICTIGVLLTTMFTTPAGSYLLEITDTILNEVGLFLAAILEVLIFSWFFGADKLLTILNKNSNIKIGKWWEILVRYVLPVLLTFIWINGIAINYNTSPIRLTLNLILTLVLILVPLTLTLLRSKSCK